MLPLIQTIWRQNAQNLKIYSLGKEPSVAPENYKIFTFNELQKNCLISSLIKCYQEVLGDEQWREGYFCSLEGWKKRVSFQVHKNSQEQGITRCDCGGDWVLCHPLSTVLQDIQKDLESSVSCCTVKIKYGQVVGFAWGRIHSIHEVCEKIKGDNYELPEAGFELAAGLIDNSYKLYNLSENDEVYWLSALGIKEYARDGIAPIIFLVRGCLLQCYQFCNERFLFITYTESHMYKIALLMGCYPIFQYHKYILLYWDKMQEQIKIFQNCDPKIIAKIMQDCCDIHFCQS